MDLTLSDLVSIRNKFQEQLKTLDFNPEQLDQSFYWVQQGVGRTVIWSLSSFLLMVYDYYVALYLSQNDSKILDKLNQTIFVLINEMVIGFEQQNNGAQFLRENLNQAYLSLITNMQGVPITRFAIQSAYFYHEKEAFQWTFIPVSAQQMPKETMEGGDIILVSGDAGLQNWFSACGINARPARNDEQIAHDFFTKLFEVIQKRLTHLHLITDNRNGLMQSWADLVSPGKSKGSGGSQQEQPANDHGRKPPITESFAAMQRPFCNFLSFWRRRAYQKLPDGRSNGFVADMKQLFCGCCGSR